MKFVFDGHVLAKPGHNTVLNKIANLLGHRVSHVSTPTHGCMSCGSSEANYYASVSLPDFDVSVLPKNIRSVFADRCLGVCRACGYGQDYRRFSSQELKSYMETLSNKDMAVSEEAFHSFPVPEDYITKFNNSYFSLRLEQWSKFFKEQNIQIEKALFLRPFFGAAPAFIKESFDAECMGLEVSEIARRTVEAKLPDFKFLTGNIHGELEGKFLTEEKFDLIYSFHTLVHCLDIKRELKKIHSMLAENGFAIFSHETTVKPSNPFHLSFNNETTFVNVLKAHFSKVERIPRCEKESSPSISNFNVFGDVADLVAFR